MKPARSRARLTAVDVARACGVDLKTIHNWANKGKLPCTRTNGRHLRFHRLDVVELLRRHAHPVPDELVAPRLHVCIVGDPGAPSRRALARRFEIVELDDAIDALLSLATIDVDALVVDDLPWLDDARVLERARVVESTRHVRIVVASDDPARRAAALRAGARAVVAPGDAPALREALDRIAAGALIPPTTSVSALRGTP